jgi:hypothetical protein
MLNVCFPFFRRLVPLASLPAGRPLPRLTAADGATGTADAAVATTAGTAAVDADFETDVAFGGIFILFNF